MPTGQLVQKGLATQQEIMRRSLQKRHAFFVLVYHPALHLLAITNKFTISGVALTTDACTGNSLLIDCDTDIQARAIFVSLRSMKIPSAVFINGKEIAQYPQKT